MAVGRRKKISKSGYFRLHTYLHTNKTLINNSLYVTLQLEEKFKQ